MRMIPGAIGHNYSEDHPIGPSFRSQSGCCHEVDRRVIARKDGPRVRLYSRPRNDLTDRFPLIVEALARLRSRSCIIDGEAVACDEKGIASFDRICRELPHDVFFAVNKEGALRAGLLLPRQQLRLVGMRGESVDGVDASPNRNILAENVHLLGAVDNTARESPVRCVADEYDARILATDIVLKVVAARGRRCTCPSRP